MTDQLYNPADEGRIPTTIHPSIHGRRSGNSRGPSIKVDIVRFCNGRRRVHWIGVVRLAIAETDLSVSTGQVTYAGNLET